MPVPGATITATSPNLQGTLIVTSAKRRLQHPAAAVRRLHLRVQVAVFEAQTRTVSIAPTQMARFDVELEPAARSPRRCR